MKVLIVGEGESGKDTFADFLVKADPLNFIYSKHTATTSFHISWFLYHLYSIWAKVPISVYKFHELRRLLRKTWFIAGEYVRSRDGEAALVKMCLDAGNNIVTGVRTDEEVKVAKKLGLVDLVVEIQNPRVGNDPTYSVKYESIDVFIENSGSLSDLESTAREFLLCENGFLSK